MLLSQLSHAVKFRACVKRLKKGHPCLTPAVCELLYVVYLSSQVTGSCTIWRIDKHFRQIAMSRLKIMIYEQLIELVRFGYVDREFKTSTFYYSPTIAGVQLLNELERVMRSTRLKW